MARNRSGEGWGSGEQEPQEQNTATAEETGNGNEGDDASGQAEQEAPEAAEGWKEIDFDDREQVRDVIGYNGDDLPNFVDDAIVRTYAADFKELQEKGGSAEQFESLREEAKAGVEFAAEAHQLKGTFSIPNWGGFDGSAESREAAHERLGQLRGEFERHWEGGWQVGAEAGVAAGQPEGRKIIERILRGTEVQAGIGDETGMPLHRSVSDRVKELEALNRAYVVRFKEGRGARLQERETGEGEAADEPVNWNEVNLEPEGIRDLLKYRVKDVAEEGQAGAEGAIPRFVDAKLVTTYQIAFRELEEMQGTKEEFETLRKLGERDARFASEASSQAGVEPTASYKDDAAGIAAARERVVELMTQMGETDEQWGELSQSPNRPDRETFVAATESVLRSIDKMVARDGAEAPLLTNTIREIEALRNQYEKGLDADTQAAMSAKETGANEASGTGSDGRTAQGAGAANESGETEPENDGKQAGERAEATGNAQATGQSGDETEASDRGQATGESNENDQSSAGPGEMYPDYKYLLAARMQQKAPHAAETFAKGETLFLSTTKDWFGVGSSEMERDTRATIENLKELTRFAKPDERDVAAKAVTDQMLARQTIATTNAEAAAAYKPEHQGDFVQEGAWEIMTPQQQRDIMVLREQIEAAVREAIDPGNDFSANDATQYIKDTLNTAKDYMLAKGIMDRNGNLMGANSEATGRTGFVRRPWSTGRSPIDDVDERLNGGDEADNDESDGSGSVRTTPKRPEKPKEAEDWSYSAANEKFGSMLADEQMASMASMLKALSATGKRQLGPKSATQDAANEAFVSAYEGEMVAALQDGREDHYNGLKDHAEAAARMGKEVNWGREPVELTSEFVDDLRNKGPEWGKLQEKSETWDELELLRAKTWGRMEAALEAYNGSDDDKTKITGYVTALTTLGESYRNKAAERYLGETQTRMQPVIETFRQQQEATGETPKAGGLKVDENQFAKIVLEQEWGENDKQDIIMQAAWEAAGPLFEANRASLNPSMVRATMNQFKQEGEYFKTLQTEYWQTPEQQGRTETEFRDDLRGKVKEAEEALREGWTDGVSADGALLTEDAGRLTLERLLDDTRKRLDRWENLENTGEGQISRIAERVAVLQGSAYASELARGKRR